MSTFSFGMLIVENIQESLFQEEVVTGIENNGWVPWKKRVKIYSWPPSLLEPSVSHTSSLVFSLGA